MLPAKDELTICFAHVAYRLHERFAARNTGIGSFEVRDADDARAQRIGEADVLVISGLWRNDLLDRAPKLRFIQSIGAGTDQFPRDELRAARHPPRQRARRQRARRRRARDGADPGAGAAGFPRRATTRRKRVWRGMIGDLDAARGRARRQDAAVVGLGDIGGRLARLAKAFDMRVIGLRRDPGAGARRRRCRCTRWAR